MKKLIKLTEKFELMLKLADEDFTSEIQNVSQFATDSVGQLTEQSIQPKEEKEEKSKQKYEEDKIYPPTLPSEKDSIPLKQNEVKPFLQKKSRENLNKLIGKPIGSFMVVNFDEKQYKTVITIHTYTVINGRRIPAVGPGIHLERVVD